MLKRSRYYSNDFSRFVLYHNYTDTRETYNVATQDNVIVPETGNLLTPSTRSPHGTHYHNRNIKQIAVLISEQPVDAGLTGASDVNITAARCVGTCTVAPNTGTIEARERKWSKSEDWRENPDDPT